MIGGLAHPAPFLAYSPVSFPRTQSENWAHWGLLQGQEKAPVWIGKFGRHPGKPATEQNGESGT